MLALARQLRGQLRRHAGLGSWAAPGSRRCGPHGARRRASGEGESIDERALVLPGGRSLAQVRAELGECTRCKLHSTREDDRVRRRRRGCAADVRRRGAGRARGSARRAVRRSRGRAARQDDRGDGLDAAERLHREHVKCRPPGNRNPQPDELEQCKPFLARADRARSRRGSSSRSGGRRRTSCSAPTRRSARCAARSTIGRRADHADVPPRVPAARARRKRDTWADLKLVMAELPRLGIQPPTRRAGSRHGRARLHAARRRDRARSARSRAREPSSRRTCARSRGATRPAVRSPRRRGDAASASLDGARRALAHPELADRALGAAAAGRAAR